MVLIFIWDWFLYHNMIKQLCLINEYNPILTIHFNIIRIVFINI